jgi:hypothetical protein
MFALLLVALLSSQNAGVWYDHLLAESGHGRLDHERAAFLILERGGALTLQPWNTRGVRHARYRGALPARVIAIVHTHPRNEPRPSARDRAEAARLGLPVVVVTNESVVAAMPDGALRVLSR